MIAIQVNVIPDLPNTIPVIVSAIILYLIFKHYTWDKIKAMLEKRSELVVSNIEESESAKAQAQALVKEYEEKLQEAKNEASEIISNARTYSEDLKAKAVKESKEEAKKEYDKGVKALELERKKVLSSVNDEIVDMAILAASKVLAEKSGPDIDKDMVKAFVSNMEEADE
ncbi:MAG: F0F1 ATP synthase subunit B [Tissierellia bacterium]|nr:F0F1 ATP synthase subunit B [Tissierellia bacterium]